MSEKRNEEEVAYAVNRALLTGEPVALRDDEVEEFEGSYLRQLSRRLTEQNRRLSGLIGAGSFGRGLT